MKRASLSDLSTAPYDVLVIGGGIYGTMVARDAALRGLRTALVEARDFGGGASHNSLKLMHGGIRYVQSLDFSRLRASARERAFWQRAAPDLIRPLEFVIPLSGYGVKGPEAFRAAAALYTLASSGVRGSTYGQARVISARQARQRMGPLAPETLRGGGVWQDGQIGDANLLQLACLQAAFDARADLANYTAAVALIARNGTVIGAQLRDALTGAEADVHARITINATGQAGAALAAPVVGPKGAARFPGFARAGNLVLDRRLGDSGVGVVSRSRADAIVDRGGRMYFFTPWQGRTVVGTYEAAPAPETPTPGASSQTATDVTGFLAELNHACPGLDLVNDDVVHVYQGVIPADVDDARGQVRRQTRGALIDHHGADGITGLISVAGVKYTTARLIAERAVNLAAAQLGKDSHPSISFETVLPCPPDPGCRPQDTDWLRRRVRDAVQTEMALTLGDLVLRRSRIGETLGLKAPAVTAAGQAMGDHLGWTAARIQAEIDGLGDENARAVTDQATAV